MKIETPPPPAMGTKSTERRRPADRAATSPGVERRKTTGAADADTVEISPEALSVRTAEDADLLAGKTRELIAQSNREALWVHSLDSKRMQDLLGRSAAPKTEGSGT